MLASLRTNCAWVLACTRSFALVESQVVVSCTGTVWLKVLLHATSVQKPVKNHFLGKSRETRIIVSALLKKLFWKNTVFHLPTTVELQWLEHLWDHENLFETGVVRANEG